MGTLELLIGMYVAEPLQAIFLYITFALIGVLVVLAVGYFSLGGIISLITPPQVSSVRSLSTMLAVVEVLVKIRERISKLIMSAALVHIGMWAYLAVRIALDHK